MRKATEEEPISQKNSENLKDNSEKHYPMTFREISQIFPGEKRDKQQNIFLNKQVLLKNENEKCEQAQEINKLTKATLLTKFFLLLKFVNTMRGLMPSLRRPNFLSKFHFDLINDLSFCYEEWIDDDKNKKTLSKCETSNFENIRKKILNLIFKVEIFDNSVRAVLIWNIICLINILILIVTIPMEIVFNVRPFHFNHVNIMNILTFCVIFLDILVSCNTSIYLKGKLIKERDKIINYYFKTTFIFDLIALFSISQQIFLTKKSPMVVSPLSVKFLFLFG